MIKSEITTNQTIASFKVVSTKSEINAAGTPSFKVHFNTSITFTTIIASSLVDALINRTYINNSTFLVETKSPNASSLELIQLTVLHEKILL